ncbi:hypothetical protein COA20_05260 [Bacillus thuringiensis]|nr:hypothetical protein COA20_05260 [Bacillus thuringiensis]PGV77987.1 hypothetical protein COD84_11175 [Bacillus cereus]
MNVYLICDRERKRAPVPGCSIRNLKPVFIILAKKTPSSRSLKGHSPVSRWEMNWLRTRDGRKPS